MSLLSKLHPHEIVPFWTLPDKYGQAYDLAKQRGRDHLLVIVAQDGAELHTFLHGLAPHAAAWRQLPARGLVVVPSADIAGALGSLPFTVLIDQAGNARRRWLPDAAQAGVFVLDRYGELYYQWLVAQMSNLPSADEIGGWLEAISMQCSI